MAGFQSLAHDDLRERPIDRLGALGAIQIRVADEARDASELASLGVDLIAFKYGNRAASKQSAEDALASILAWPTWSLKVSPMERVRIAEQSLMEWAIDICPACQGARVVPSHHQTGLEGFQPMQPCSTCSGSGKRRYSDLERVEAMGEAFSRAMYTAHGIIGRAESLAVAGAKDMLERW